MRGSPLAQVELANKCMEESVKMYSEDPVKCNDLRLMASVLFSLAAQQGNDGAKESLLRVLNIERTFIDVNGEDDIETFASPIIHTVQAADIHFDN
eukprot:15328758-Ditylum_brightwellii.AAC.1